jgi:hypothetical protein
MLQGWSIVDTISSGTDRIAEVTECFDNQVLENRKDVSAETREIINH